MYVSIKLSVIDDEMFLRHGCGVIAGIILTKCCYFCNDSTILNN